MFNWFVKLMKRVKEFHCNKSPDLFCYICGKFFWYLKNIISIDEYSIFTKSTLELSEIENQDKWLLGTEVNLVTQPVAHSADLLVSIYNQQSGSRDVSGWWRGRRTKWKCPSTVYSRYWSDEMWSYSNYWLFYDEMKWFKKKIRTGNGIWLWRQYPFMWYRFYTRKNWFRGESFSLFFHTNP